MQTAIIAGCFAFIGAVVGQLLNRNTQRETWLLQRRAEAYSKFYVDIEIYESEVFRIDDSLMSDIEGMKHKMYALEKLHASANIVRLYLPIHQKMYFMESLNSYIHYKFTDMSNLEDLAKEYKKRDGLKNNIANIFEISLEKIKWY